MLTDCCVKALPVCLIKIVTTGEDGEAPRRLDDRTGKVGKAKHERAERLPNCAEKVKVSPRPRKLFGLVGEADEAASQAADAALQSDGCLPFS